MVLVYLPTKLGHLWGFYVGKYSSTMDSLGLVLQPELQDATTRTRFSTTTSTTTTTTTTTLHYNYNYIYTSPDAAVLGEVTTPNHNNSPLMKFPMFETSATALTDGWAHSLTGLIGR